MVIAVVVWNWEFFAPVREGPVTDTEKFAGEAWRIQQAAGIYDYLPNTAKIAPDSKRTVLAEIIEGKGIIYFENHPERTNWLTFDADIKEGGAVVRINVLAFPDWKVLIDGNQVPTYIDEVEEWGRLYVDIPEGKHFVYARLYNTPIRNIANGISLVTWLGFLSFPLVPEYAMKAIVRRIAITKTLVSKELVIGNSPIWKTGSAATEILSFFIAILK